MIALFTTQIRHLRKSFNLREGYYGKPPLFLEEQYLQAKEENRLEELEFEKIRFATINEADSPLYDHTHEIFSKLVMKDGRKDLAYDLMHRTFYEIKIIQLKKFRRRQQYLEDVKSGKRKVTDVDPTEQEQIIELDPMVIFKQALKNVEPLVTTKNIRRGGAVYQVPFPLRAIDSEYLAHKWMIRAVLDRPKPRKQLFPEVMARELVDAFENKGKVIKKRDDIHRLADANKAYAHYRWG